MTKRNLHFAVTAACSLLAAHADAVNFSLGVGTPYLLVTELSHDFGTERYRWYANYRLGFKRGPSFGVERAVGSTGKGALGLSAGAVGIRDADTVDCGPPPAPSTDIIDLGPGLYGLCGVSEAFDLENVIGLGANVKYAPRGLNARGWNLRLEVGYGEGQNSGNNAAAGNAAVIYQF